MNPDGSTAKTRAAVRSKLKVPSHVQLLHVRQTSSSKRTFNKFIVFRKELDHGDTDENIDCCGSVLLLCS